MEGGGEGAKKEEEGGIEGARERRGAFQIQGSLIFRHRVTRVPTPLRSFRIKFNVSCAADLSGVMGTLIFLMSSDAVGEINFASFRPGFISSWLEIHWKNKRHDKRERKKKTGEWEKREREVEERDGATGDDRTNHGPCPAANQSAILLLVSHIVHFYV